MTHNPTYPINANVLNALFERIGETSSKTEKENLLREGECEALRYVLWLALNPFRTYGIAKRPHLPPIKDEGRFQHTFDIDTYMLLEKLANRTLSGNAAREALMVEMLRLTEPAENLLWKIISRDLRAGFSASTVNKVFPGLIPTFDCMLAHPYHKYAGKVQFPLAVEPKLDGVRVLAFVSSRDCHFYSRSGQEWTTFDHLKEPLIAAVNAWMLENTASVDRFVFDGEIVSGDFNKTVGDARRTKEQATDAKFCMFDMMPAMVFDQDKDASTEFVGPYTMRSAQLALFAKLFEGDPMVRALPSQLVHNEAQLMQVYDAMRSRGLEGIVAKDPQGLYMRRRNKGWLKVKAEESEDLSIVGFEEGTGKYAGMLGAVTVLFEGKRVSVGSGFSDEQRRLLWEDNAALMGRLIEVEYHEKTPDGSLRHPRFKRFRDTLAAGVKE